MAQRSEPEAGTAFILSLLLAVITAGLVFAGVVMLDAHRRNAATGAGLVQATQTARAGVADALNWFRQQTSQPVTTFAPRRDLAATPPITDTLDPDLGLTREFAITGAVWGRYEVWKEWAADPDAERLAWREQVHVEDVSTARGATGAGRVWMLRSVGHVYRRHDGAKRFDEPPNHVLASDILEVELRRLVFTPPGAAGICAGDGNSVHINTLGRVLGGADGAGIYYPAGTGAPTVGPVHDHRVTGTPDLLASASYDDSLRTVFGLSEQELRAAADRLVLAANEFPDPVPKYALVYCKLPSITFDAARPLRGFAAVYIDGNVAIAQGSGSDFKGILYVKGSLSMRAPAEIRGTVIIRGNMSLQGAGAYASVYYDPDVLNELQRGAGRYRIAGAMKSVLGNSDR